MSTAADEPDWLLAHRAREADARAQRIAEREAIDPTLGHRLAAAVMAGDAEAVVVAIEEATEKERRATGPLLHDHVAPDLSLIPFRLLRGESSADTEITPQREAGALAVLGTTWAPGLRFDLGWPLVLDERTERVVSARGQGFATAVAKAVLADRFHGSRWAWIRLLMRLGLAERPPDAVYLPMVAGVLDHACRDDPDGVAARLRAEEPDLLVEARLVLERTPEVVGRHRFDHAITVLGASDDLPRADVLRGVLGGLSTDCGEHVGLGQVLDTLAPTAEERRAVVATYLRTVDLPDPAAQKEGLARLTALLDAGEVIHTGDLAAAVRRPLIGARKGLALAALALLDRLATERPADLEPVQTAVAEGLTSARVDVQQRTLRLLERRWPDDPNVAARLATVVGQLGADASATLRDRIDALVGDGHQDRDVATSPVGVRPSAAALRTRVESLSPDVRQALALDAAVAAVEDGRWPAAARFAPDAAPVLEPARALASVTDDDELVALWTGMLEGEGGAWEIEQAIAGMAVRGVDLLAAGRLAPLLKRAGTRGQHRSSLAAMAATAVAIWAGQQLEWAERRHRQVARGGASGAVTPLGFVGLRMEEAALAVAGGRRAPLLATPTHRSGWVDLIDVFRRLRDGRDAGATTALRFDVIATALRIAPRPGIVEMLGRAPSPIFDAFAHALGAAVAPDDPALAAPGRRVDLDDAELITLVPPPGGRVSDDVNPAVTVALPDAPRLQAVDPIGVLLHRLRTDDGARIRSDVFAAETPGEAEIALWSLPRHPDLAAAASILVSSASVDTTKYHRRGDLVIGGAVDPDVRLGRIGSMAVAMALANAHEQAAATGLDVFLAAAEDGRLDPDAVGEAWAHLAAAGSLRCGRLGRPLAEASRTSDRTAVAVVRSVAALLGALDDVPHDLHVPFEAMLEACARTGLGVEPAAARARLEAIAAASPSSKRGRLARAALDRPVGGEAAIAPRWDALAAQVERAERWAMVDPAS